MSLRRQRTRVGVPLINEAQEPFQRPRETDLKEWIVPTVPDKAASNPRPPWANPNLPEASERVEIGSSYWSLDDTTTTGASSASTISLEIIPKATFAHLRTEEFQQVLREMRVEEFRQGRRGIATNIDETARAVTANTEFRLVCRQMKADLERRARDGQGGLSPPELIARYMSLAKAKPGPPIPPTPVIAPSYKPPPPLLAFTFKSPPLRQVPPPLPPVPPKPTPAVKPSPPQPSPQENQDQQTEPGLSSGSEEGPSTPRTTETLEHRAFGDEMVTGTQPWTMINARNTPGSIEINPDARPFRCDPQYEWVWQNFRTRQYEAEREYWLPERPPENSEIGSEMLTTYFQYKQNHWLLVWDDSKHDPTSCLQVY